VPPPATKRSTATTANNTAFILSFFSFSDSTAVEKDAAEGY
jgi:hypothetical protein